MTKPAENDVRIVKSKDGWHWKKGRARRSEPYYSEYGATKAARAALGHDPLRNYPRA